MFNKNFWRPTLLFIILTELLSLGVFLLPEFRILSFVFLVSVFLIVSLIDLKYGVFVMLVELIIGSKGGYLFSLDMSGHLLSIRITFWIILLLVWFIKIFLPALIKGKLKQLFPINNSWFKYFGILIFFILWGLLNGFLNHNSFSNIFFDFNAYLYFLSMLPLLSLLQVNKEKLKEIRNEIIQIFSVAVFWISLKTLFLLFLFSHQLSFINSYLYSWVRTSGVGEITKVQGGFYRIFFQSHIFVLASLIGFLIVLTSFLNNNKNKIKNIVKTKKFIWVFSFLVTLLTTSLASMSRSNWVGFIVAMLLIFVYSLWRFKMRGFISFFLVSFILFLFSFTLLISLVKFPYPQAIGGFTTGNLLTERASEVKNEAGVSSRWNLLPKLTKEIKSSFFLGKGFGSTVTYISNDPRVRQNNPDGKYTTFAFEWGWLDIWLKLGILGFLSYVLFLLSIIIELFRKYKKSNNEIFIALAIVLVSLSAINFFSPYLNHPLGIGLVLYVIFLMKAIARPRMTKKRERRL